nr:PREDICTED: putative disease resistance protein RGA1 [Musa acuminata subsp. malaccensis]
MELLSAVIPLLASSLVQLWEELQTVYGLDAELKKLQSSVAMIQAVLNDAQERQQIRNAVKHLLNELSQAAYDANDILDEVATERQRCQLIKYASFALDQLKHKFPALKKLVIEASRRFVGLSEFPALKSLEVKTTDDWIWSSWSVVSLLPSLTLSGLQRRTLPFNIQGSHALIRRLEISHCNQLLSLPDDWLPTSLLYLAIKHCPELHTLPKGLPKLIKLEDLEIENCRHLKYLPVGLRNMASLARLEISDCPGLLCLPNDGFPSKLQFLSISNCPELLLQCLGMGDQGWFTLQHNLQVWIDGELQTSLVHHYPQFTQALNISS